MGHWQYWVGLAIACVGSGILATSVELAKGNRGLWGLILVIVGSAVLGNAL